MWAMLVVSVVYGVGSGAPHIATVDGFTSREKCIAAVNFSKKRESVIDAWCVQK